MKVVIVTGSRKWGHVEEVKLLYDALDLLDPEWVVHGGAVGADSFAEKWCKRNGRKSKVYYPDYQRLGKGAPLKRNTQMVVDHPDATVLGCPYPDSRGTLFTMKEGARLGNEVMLVKYYEPPKRRRKPKNG